MSSPAVPSPGVVLPIPISKVAHRYMLYDVNAVTYLRREHNICGVLSGTLPQASQQNVFLGLPLELMPEEARLLVEKQVAYIVDDVAEHKSKFLNGELTVEERRSFQSALRKQGQAAAQEASKKSEDRKKAALQKLGTENWNDIPDDMFAPRSDRPKKKRGAERATTPSGNATDENDLVFGSSDTPPSTSTPSRAASVVHSTAGPDPYAITPTTSAPPFTSSEPDPESTLPLPTASKAYPLFKKLHSEGYFMSPGLRFGCQYAAYPGDPLRYHSHFLCNGMDWDQEFDLIDIVGGGRLGTGVKKGFLIGGAEPSSTGSTSDPAIRAFCIEWGGM